MLLTTLRLTLLTLMGLAIASAQEAWQTNYSQFLNTISPYIQNSGSSQSVADMRTRFGNKPITWEGQFASYGFNNAKNSPLVNIAVPSIQVSVPGSSRTFETVPTIEFFPSLENAKAWQSMTKGNTVKFRTTLVNPIIQILDGIRYVNFVFGDLEFVDPALKPAISLGGVVNGASFLEGLAPASWITIRGSNLSDSTRIWEPKDFQGNQLPRSLDGVSVKVNGKEALIYFISPTQINALAPDDISRGAVSLTVTNTKGSSAAVTANLGQYSPALFAFDPEGRKYVAAVHPDGVYAGKAGLFGAALTTRPARAGDRILLFGTGFGSESPAGQLVDKPKPLENMKQFYLRIGGIPTLVEYAGLTTSGLYQFNIVIPNLAPGEHAVVAEIGGISSLGKVFLSVVQ